jgi:hypothetical protein
MTSGREDIMASLGISEDDLVENKALVIEKLFCVALLNSSTDVCSKVLNDFLKLRDLLYPKE